MDSGRPGDGGDRLTFRLHELEATLARRLVCSEEEVLPVESLDKSVAHDITGGSAVGADAAPVTIEVARAAQRNKLGSRQPIIVM